MAEPVFISENPESFGVAMRKLREIRGWTRADFLRQLGKATGYYMHATTLKRIEDGEKIARVHEALMIAKIFGMTIEEMGEFGTDDEKQVLVHLKHANALFSDTGTRLADLVAQWLQKRQTLRNYVEEAEKIGLTENDDENLATAYRLLAEFGTLDAIQKRALALETNTDEE